MDLALSDYALIGNCRGTALISRYGSVDWCCLPEFDSPAIFAALLDRKSGGYFSIAPVSSHQSSQRYVPDTNVLETFFTCDAGQIRLTDAFTAQTEGEKQRSLFPDHELLRIVEGVSGRVRVKMECAPRPFYGQHLAALKDRKKLGIRFSYKENIYSLLTTIDDVVVEKEIGANKVTAIFDINAGDRHMFSLSYCDQSPTVLPELKQTGFERMKRTISFWKDWSNRSEYTGMYSEEVKRSALVLKLLTHAPSGAIVAAPTTSLPEHPGGARNWDYRYCWLRDASFTTRVLMSLGYEQETHAYMNWILHATRLTRPKLQVVYSVFGEARLKEKTLPWLRGYQDSRPVRIGNKADGQFQLDVYGEVLDAAFTYARLIKKFDSDTRRFLVGLGKVICKVWDQPDNGIWEIRSDAIHHTHSKVMAWVGLDRLIKLCQTYNWNQAPVEMFKDTAARIRDEVDRLGYNRDLKTYTRELRGIDVDASALTFSLVGYAEASSQEMVSTTDMICKQLSKSNLVYRYRGADDGLPGNEGAFGVCSFWLAENLAKSGRLDEAMNVFETVVKHASPTGLLSEEIDPASGQLLGNYPQGFTHIGLINAALTIDEVYKKAVDV